MSYAVRVRRSDELYHHGIKGMKWGVRRFQNKNGSYTSAGKGRYSNSSGSGKKSGMSTAKKVAIGLGTAAAVGVGAYALKKSGLGGKAVSAVKSAAKNNPVSRNVRWSTSNPVNSALARQKLASPFRQTGAAAKRAATKVGNTRVGRSVRVGASQKLYDAKNAVSAAKQRRQTHKMYNDMFDGGVKNTVVSKVKGTRAASLARSGKTAASQKLYDAKNAVSAAKQRRQTQKMYNGMFNGGTRNIIKSKVGNSYAANLVGYHALNAADKISGTRVGRAASSAAGRASTAARSARTAASQGVYTARNAASNARKRRQTTKMYSDLFKYNY